MYFSFYFYEFQKIHLYPLYMSARASFGIAKGAMFKD